MWFPAALLGRAARPVHALLEFVTPSGLDDAGSTRDAEGYEREPRTGLYDGTLFAVLAVLFWLLTVKVWFK